MKTRILPHALAELEACVAHISRDSHRAAAELAAQVFATIDLTAAGDFEGPESLLRTGQRVRSWPVPPLRIYDQRRQNGLFVLRIYHQARRPL